ncbi:MAG TPA: glycosyltransferase family 9 protein [Vicinamibacterales bacterium]|nr:glycosyltransferase family 9 protein [Vicinamibacterales bacterium]
MNRFLLVRLGALGDIVHAIPVAAALRRAFPAARIDWLVGAKHHEVLDLVPVIDRRLAFHDSSFVSAIRELRSARYDVTFDLQGLIKSAALARSSGAGRVIGFSSLYARERLARLFYTEVYDPGRGGLYDPRETRHVVEINLGLLERIGLTAGRAEFPIDRIDSNAARQVAGQTGGRYAILNPGAAWPNKRWPPARFAALARTLRDRHGLVSAILWGPGEEALAQEIAAGAPGAAIVSPKTTIADLVALARGAALMVSGDTGPMHVASALGVPLVGLFGPTRPSRNGPIAPADVTVTRDAACQCHHLRQCKRGRMCLEDIEVEEVAGAVARRLDSASDAAGAVANRG